MANDPKPATAGKECVWDYPRPPRLEPTPKQIRVEFAGAVLADSRSAFRVLETSHPPVYYIPPKDVAIQYLVKSPGSSYCEWKGRAGYYSVVVGDACADKVAWFYADPTPAFHPIRDYIAFYPGPMDGCFVDGERVVSQPGDFYGGWITSDLVAPSKAEPEPVAGSDAGAVVGRGRPSSLRLQHVALNVGELQACERFYREILGLEVIWRPDEDSVYLTNGSDNLALHRAPQARPPVPQSLDHIGFALEDESAVDAWHDYLSFHGVAIVAPPRTHRDGTRSLYCKDPDGNTVQLLYESRAAGSGAGSQRQPGKGADLELKTPECDCWNSLDPNNRGCSCVASWARPT